MGTKNNPGKFDCYAALDPNEPHFVLRSTDRLGPGLVRLWALLRSNNPISAIAQFAELVETAGFYENVSMDKIAEAEACADAMAAWHEANPK